MCAKAPKVQKTFVHDCKSFQELTSVGSYANGVYCEIRLPRFLIFVVKKTTCSHGCVQYCGLLTLPGFWIIFVIFYCIACDVLKFV